MLNFSSDDQLSEINNLKAFEVQLQYGIFEGLVNVIKFYCNIHFSRTSMTKTGRP